MQKCTYCGNTEFTKQGLCTYCVWKGDAGPGKLAKEIIKEHNKKLNEKKGDRND